MPTTTYAGQSDVGSRRSRNDNRWGADPGQGLYMVADGVGSTSHGDLAAALVVDMLPEYVARHLPPGAILDPQATARLGTAVLEMCNDLYARSQQDEDLGSADTTLVSAVIGDSRALIAHLGDSRAYLYRGGQVHRLTSDHTIVQAVMDAGEITAEEAANHPNRSVVTRHVLMTPPAKPEVSALDLQPGDRILLCSDGLHGVVDDATLGAILTDHPDPVEACRVLIDAANRGGGPDNITAVVVNSGEGPASEPASGAATVPDRVVVPESPPTQQSPVPPMPAGYQQSIQDLAATQQLPPGPPPGPAGPPPPGAAGPPPPMGAPPLQPVPPRSRGRGLMYALLAAIVILVIGAVAAAYFLWPRPAPAPTAAQSSAGPSASQGGQPSAQPSKKAQSALPIPGYKHLQGLAIDGSGNLYVIVGNGGDDGHLMKLSPSGSAAPSEQQAFRDLKAPYGVAVDSAGDVFVTDVAHGGRVTEMKVGSGDPAADILPPGKQYEHRISRPAGVAVDSTGDIFVADREQLWRIIKNGEPRGGDGLEVLGQRFDHPTGVAVDGKGHVFVVEQGANKVWRVTSAAQEPALDMQFPGLNRPAGIAVDNDGNVYVADSGNRRVVKLPAGQTAPVDLGITGLSNPVGLAVDSDGTVYVADDGAGQVVRFPQAS
jgi:PPM family protein phosphatase